MDMAEGFIGKVVEFLLGFFLVPVVVGVIGGTIIFFLIPLLGVASSESQFIYYSRIGMFILKGAVLVLLFFIRKMVAIGYLVGIIIDFVFGFAVSPYLGINTP